MEAKSACNECRRNSNITNLCRDLDNVIEVVYEESFHIGLQRRFTLVNPHGFVHRSFAGSLAQSSSRPTMTLSKVVSMSSTNICVPTQFGVKTATDNALYGVAAGVVSDTV